MLALSIRQPFAELILRGIKTAEFRSRATRRVGERFYIYAARARAKLPVWSADLAVPGTNTGGPHVPPWMIELAQQISLLPQEIELPTGVIVGSAVIERCELADGSGQLAADAVPAARCPPPAVFKWHLADVQRAKRLRKPRGHPQPVWFRPF